MEELFKERFGTTYIPENFDEDYDTPITFEVLSKECEEAWTGNALLQNRFKTPEDFTALVISHLSWEFPDILIEEVITDLEEEEEEDEY